MGASAKLLAYMQGITARQSREEVAAGSGVHPEAVSKILYNWIKRGRVVEDDRKLVLLNPDFVPYAHQKAPRLPPKLKGNKAAARDAKKKARKVRTYGDLVKKLRAPRAAVSEDQPSQGQLLALHVRSSWDAVLSVMDLSDAAPMLAAAFKVHGEAVALLGGVRE